MLTGQELIHALLVPVIVAGVLAAAGRWRRWGWAMPLAAGAGFLTGYALIGVPRLPPRDGIDWLFWLAIPLVLLGVVDTVAGERWNWALGAVTAAAAGPASLVLIMPLARVGSVSMASAVATAVVLAVVGAMLVLILRFAIDRVGPAGTIAGLCIVVGGAGLMVMSSNLRIVGIYGLAAAAALVPVAVLVREPRAARGVVVVAVPLIAGVLTAGYFYPDPGVTGLHFALILGSPLLLAAVAAMPMKRTGLRAALAVLAVAVLIGAITIPTAIAAKRAAESDPYEAYY